MCIHAVLHTERNECELYRHGIQTTELRDVISGTISTHLTIWGRIPIRLISLRDAIAALALRVERLSSAITIPQAASASKNIRRLVSINSGLGDTQIECVYSANDNKIVCGSFDQHIGHINIY